MHITNRWYERRLASPSYPSPRLPVLPHVVQRPQGSGGSELL